MREKHRNVWGWGTELLCLLPMSHLPSSSVSSPNWKLSAPLLLWPFYWKFLMQACLIKSLSIINSIFRPPTQVMLEASNQGFCLSAGQFPSEVIQEPVKSCLIRAEDAPVIFTIQKIQRFWELQVKNWGKDQVSFDVATGRKPGFWFKRVGSQ